MSSDAELRARWRELVERRLPEAARGRGDWPVRLDHCFARILLDNACGRPWREAVSAPAWRNAPARVLAAASTLGERVLQGEADLAALNRRSLALRGKLAALPSPPLRGRVGEGGVGAANIGRVGAGTPLPVAARLGLPRKGGG